jgi:hypothetical protein
MTNYSNIADDTTLDVGINDSVTTLDVISATGYPDPDFNIEINYDVPADMEVINVGAKAGLTFSSLTRGYDGTTEKAHSAGAKIRHAGIAKDLGSPGHKIRDDLEVFTQREAMLFTGGGVTVTDASGLDDYHTLLDTYSPSFSITLAVDESDRTSTVTPTENGSPTYSQTLPPTEASVLTTDFDGSSDYIQIPYSVTYTDGTYIIWYKGSDVGTDDLVNGGAAQLMNMNIDGGNKRWVVAIDSDGSARVAFGDSYPEVAGTVSINNDVWHMIAFTIDVSGTDTLELFVDGVSEGTNTSADNGHGTPALRIMGPARGTNLAAGFAGEASHIPSILLESELLDLYNSRTVALGEVFTTVTIPTTHTVSTTEPTSPGVGDVWVNPNESPGAGGGYPGTWLDALFTRPETAHADDDEFDDDIIDAAWTELVVTGTTVWSEKGSRLNAEFIDQASNDLSPILKSLGSLTSPVTIETAVTASAILTSFTQFGLVFADGVVAGSEAVAAKLQYPTVSGQITQSLLAGTLTNMTVNVTTTLNSSGAGNMVYLRLIWSAANTWKYYWSFDGQVWVQHRTAGSRTMTPTHFGLFVSTGNVTAFDRVAAFEYFRVTESDLSL